jgi:hypothetical protein|tara:strand:- start:11776 stop:12198 length:423 start_codon:yes stop_codon:yes gene_type:complete
VVYFCRIHTDTVNSIQSLHGAFCYEEPAPESMVYYVPLPNVYSNWKLCINNAGSKDRDTIEAAVQYFWSSPFSPVSMEWHGCKVMLQLYETLKNWSEMTLDQVLNKDLSHLPASATGTLDREYSFKLTYANLERYIIKRG